MGLAREEGRETRDTGCLDMSVKCVDVNVLIVSYFVPGAVFCQSLCYRVM